MMTIPASMNVLTTENITEEEFYRLRIMNDRYVEIFRHQNIQSQFSENEWNLMRDSLRGVFNQPAAFIADVWYGIEDSIKFDDLAEKWSVNG